MDHARAGGAARARIDDRLEDHTWDVRSPLPADRPREPWPSSDEADGRSWRTDYEETE